MPTVENAMAYDPQFITIPVADYQQLLARQRALLGLHIELEAVGLEAAQIARLVEREELSAAGSRLACALSVRETPGGAPVVVT